MIFEDILTKIISLFPLNVNQTYALKAEIGNGKHFKLSLLAVYSL